MALAKVHVIGKAQRIYKMTVSQQKKKKKKELARLSFFFGI
jgi:hypothetical protein